MISGPDLVIACPVCQALAKVFTVESFDSCGTITWSDGWQDAPMMPRPPRITRCAQCRKLYWTAEAPQLGYAPPPELATAEHVAWTEAPFVEPLDEEGVAEALASGLAPTPDLEMELRVLRWWRGNDAFRRLDAPIGHATQSDAVANMERIIEMMQDGQEDLLLFRAEAQRELGQFEDALRTLDGVCCSDWWPAKSRLLSFIEARSQRLEILFATDVAPPELPTT